MYTLLLYFSNKNNEEVFDISDCNIATIQCKTFILPYFSRKKLNLIYRFLINKDFKLHWNKYCDKEEENVKL